ncbi:zinc finger MYM-type protein 1-like [Xenia sp. Carnegie-2017]|uniref:zinc finger MYM-type protein 1-like n=1 Tax=Xenia sp. Carnegie-2017 TaxID=2897299 RepID=UPI001F038702|nr:zinc finger MYM-type protein 1-like [Xenia sp. Carnegie-2017]
MTECIVESLLSRSFGLRPFSEKREIVEGGRPTPELQGLHTTSKRSGKVFIRSFQTSNYDKYKWLAGFSKLNKLICWPCLLFNSTDKTVWCKKGYDDLANLCNAVNRHEKTKTRLSSCLMNASFGRTRIDMQLDEQARQHISAHNLMVHKNREVLRRFIDVVCFLGKQELSFRGRVELEESANRGNYVELIKLLSAYDPTLEQHLHTATVFSGLSNRIQNDLIVAVKDVMLEAIKDEVMRSPFVAISLDETSDVKTLSQLTTIVRYVNPDGKAVERFLGFTDVSEDRTAARLKQEVGKTLNEYGCGGKLIAQTYDGASVMSGELSAVSSTKECRIFFKTVTGLSSFFHASSKRTYLLDTVVGRRIPTGTAVRWHYQSRLIHAVLETRAKLLEVFEYIIENDDEFDEIFGLTDVLYNIIQSKQFDIVFCVTKVRETKDKIQEQRTKFVDYWNFTSSIVKVALKRGQSEEDVKASFREMFFCAVDTIVVQIDSRFESLNSRAFVSLLDYSKHELYSRNFPERELQSLQDSYGTFFNLQALKSELIVVYASAELKSKPVFDMISKIIELDLKACFPEVYRLCQLILTMPSTSSSAERSIIFGSQAYQNVSSQYTRARATFCIGYNFNRKGDVGKFAGEATIL